MDVEVGRRVVERFAREERGLVEAMVADGWPEAMAREGLALHLQSWDVEQAAGRLERELAAVGPGQRVVWPKMVSHIWPMLPGAGVGPVLLGEMIGVKQGVRLSRRGACFGRKVCELAGWEVLQGERWGEAEVVVVSGSDATLHEIGRLAPGARVVGYGHRVSFGVLVDGVEVDLQEEARRFARDVVMWRQSGCFSVRAIVVVGEEARWRAFGKALAGCIAAEEARLGAGKMDEVQEAARAQGLALAQMQGEVYSEGVGYVRLAREAFEGGERGPHAVSVHRVEGIADLAPAVVQPRGQVQGVALGGAWAGREDLLEEVVRLGATRVAPAGQMQAPPLAWWHDGRANLLGWARVVEVSEVG
ncbi:hypothetical protein DL240_07305 [Lujinxingia litoralis]|uniref:Long-chain-fatty-acyl-CoA reductase n=1 Tax=Lujinxingia litoralis TaxID=2211119 RepID=A0A328CCN5_9DELT|nr:hypothetical protein DL240_07305 [Lujinxingia litoralis]